MHMKEPDSYAYTLLCLFLEGRQNNKAEPYVRIVDSNWQLSLHPHWRKVNRMMGFMRESMSKANKEQKEGREGHGMPVTHGAWIRYHPDSGLMSFCFVCSHMHT